MQQRSKDERYEQQLLDFQRLQRTLNDAIAEKGNLRAQVIDAHTDIETLRNEVGCVALSAAHAAPAVLGAGCEPESAAAAPRYRCTSASVTSAEQAQGLEADAKYEHALRVTQGLELELESTRQRVMHLEQAVLDEQARAEDLKRAAQAAQEVSDEAGSNGDVFRCRS